MVRRKIIPSPLSQASVTGAEEVRTSPFSSVHSVFGPGVATGVSAVGSQP